MMHEMDGGGRAASSAVLVCLGLAGVFEVLTVPGIQDKTIWAATPWREDPYHTVVWLAEFAVLALAAVIASRLPAWQALGGADRAQQTVRAAGAMTALIATAVAFEWAATIRGASPGSWGTWTRVQLGGLVISSALTGAATASLARCRRPRGSAGPWRHDWLGDVVFLCRPIPWLARWAGPGAAAWARRRAMTVFVVLSILVGAVFTGVQAIGERLTDPLLIAWMWVAESACNLAFCAIGNAVTGLIARPPRTRSRRVAEASVVAGCLVTPAVIAFHDPLWSVLGSGPLTPLGLAALTLGAGLLASLVMAGVLLTRTPRAAWPGRDDAPPT